VLALRPVILYVDISVSATFFGGGKSSLVYAIKLTGI